MSLTMFVGGIVGFLSGLTATGGGVFLSPLLIYPDSAKIREALLPTGFEAILLPS
jgi:uncharacterized membrane protein YfcA